MKKPPGAILARDERPFELEFQGSLPGLEIAYETWGTLSASQDNAVMVCPAFSAHSHARSNEADSSPGWWEAMIGPGLALDTDRWFVICASLLGGCYGTTGPLAAHPDGDGAWGPRFPVISVRDMTNAHVRLLDLLEIDRLHAVAGGSLGAMQGLQMAVEHPGRVERTIAISGTGHTRPYTAAIRHLGRKAIMSDPGFKGGLYGDDPPAGGLRLARELGTLLYRSREEFNDRFDNTPINDPSLEGITFDVQSYLGHQGQKALDRFDANSYLAMSMAMDLHDMSRSHGDLDSALGKIESQLLLVGVSEDRLIPLDEQEDLHESLDRIGKAHQWHVISSRIGHDAFLVEIDAMTPLFRDFLG